MSLQIPQPSKQVAAIAMLSEQGYTWFPTIKKWVRFPGLPLEEIEAAPGWYRCAQVKPLTKELRSWDGYTLVTQDGAVIHFTLNLKQRKWSPPIGYEKQVCFVAVDIAREIRLSAELS